MTERPDYGTKMMCSSCGERFFDLNRTPITCPMCDYVYPTDEEKAVAAEAPKESNIDEAEINIGEDEAEEGAEFISLEEADAATISELTGGDDDDANVNPDEDSFLEEDGTSTSIDDVVIVTSSEDEHDS